jgi:hypothetical protein
MLDFMIGKIAELSAPANTIILIGILFILRNVRQEIKLMKENDIAHLNSDMAGVKADLAALRTTVQNISNYIIQGHRIG